MNDKIINILAKCMQLAIVGFTIAACVGIWRFAGKTNKSVKEDVKYTVYLIGCDNDNCKTILKFAKKEKCEELRSKLQTQYKDFVYECSDEED